MKHFDTRRRFSEGEIAGRRRPWRRLGGLGAFGLLAVFVVRALATRLSAVQWDALPWSASLVVTAVTALVLSMAFHAAALLVLARSVGLIAPYRVLMAGSLVATMGKYIPGKAASAAGLVWLLKRRGESARAVGGVVVLRLGMVVVVGLLMATPLTLSVAVRAVWPAAPWASLAVVLTGGTCLIPPVFRRIANLLLRLTRQPPLERLPGVAAMGLATVLIAGMWGSIGLVLFAVCRMVSGEPMSYPHCLAAAALSQTAGLLAVFAPAGLGVREALVLACLEPVVGPSAAAATAVVHRLLHTLVEVALAAVGWMVLRASAKPTTGEHAGGPAWSGGALAGKEAGGTA